MPCRASLSAAEFDPHRVAGIVDARRSPEAVSKKPCRSSRWQGFIRIAPPTFSCFQGMAEVAPLEGGAALMMPWLDLYVCERHHVRESGQTAETRGGKRDVAHRQEHS